MIQIKVIYSYMKNVLKDLAEDDRRLPGSSQGFWRAQMLLLQLRRHAVLFDNIWVKTINFL